MHIVLGIFCILHGFVHALYGGHSLGLYQMQEGMTWPEGAWLLSLVADGQSPRTLAAFGAFICTAGFVAAGIGLIGRLSWGQPATLTVGIFSTLYYLAMWNGRPEHLSNQGLVGVAINLLVIVVAFLILRPQTA